MTTKTDITLAPACVAAEEYTRRNPNYEKTDTELYNAFMAGVAWQARAAVEADRQGRMPSDEDLDDLSDEFHGYSGNHTRDGYLIPKFDYIGYARALLSRYGQPAASAEPCPICCEDEPHTGACGSSDPRALCNQPAAPVAQKAAHRWPFVESPGEFTSRLKAALGEFHDLLPAVRFVLIENPPTFAAPVAQEPVAYLDLGAGGYMDVGTDLTDEQLAALPKGRHMLAIIGTYGVDGYVAAPVAAQAQPIQWPTMPPRKGQSPVLFDDGYEEGWAKCMSECQKAVAAQAQPTMPALTDAMRAVLRNEHCVYDSEDTLYAALCDAAQAQQQIHPAIREGVEAAFEQRPGWLEKIGAAVRHLPNVAAPAATIKESLQVAPESAQDREDAAVLTSDFSKGYELGLRQRTSQDREDAERYRWLRRHDSRRHATGILVKGILFDGGESAEKIDAIVDAARAAKGE